jgi:hypothetical protein
MLRREHRQPKMQHQPVTQRSFVALKNTRQALLLPAHYMSGGNISSDKQSACSQLMSIS